MAAKLTDAQKRRRDALRIRRIIESAEMRVVRIFQKSPALWFAWHKKRGKVNSYHYNPKAEKIARPLERAYDAADKLAAEGK